MSLKTSTKSPRAPGFVYGALTVALLIVVGIVALTAVQPPPPSIAEFAPQAVQQIRQADANQSFGSGLGSSAPPPVPPATVQSSTDGAEIEVARVRKCVGDPPRQIEDPQSPPCVPYFQGDNGGVTHKGVTRDEIRIALPIDTDVTEATMPPEWKGMRDFFNKRMEFYGRKVRLIPINVGGDHAENPRASVQTGHAVAIDESMNAFASLPYPDTGGSTIFYDELARRKIVSVSGLVAREPEEHFQKWHPYEWSYIQTMDQSGENTAEFVCNQLKGDTAQWAGAVLADQPRVFGLMVTDYADGDQDTTKVLGRLKQCGIEPVVVHQLYGGPDDGAAGARAALALQQAGVTTVICLCHIFSWCLYTMPGASQQGYFPEWVRMSFPFVDNGTNIQVCPKDQIEHAFGTSGFSKWVETENLPITWAMKEADPTYSWTADTIPHEYSYRRYTPLLLLMSGIQMAGPNLTPHTFASGLQRAKFPNPETPWFAGKVGFADDHTMPNDYATVWWSSSAQSTWGGAGAWCYADRGERHSLGNWPKRKPRVFQGSCY